MYLSGKEARKKENFNRDWYFFHEKETAFRKTFRDGKAACSGRSGHGGISSGEAAP